jgi:preprotein translocase subunit YajC
MDKRKTWVRADKLQPGDQIQDSNGNIATIKDVSKELFPIDPDYAARR